MPVTETGNVMFAASGNQSPGPIQSAANSIVPGVATALVLNSAASSPATSPTVTSQQVAGGGQIGFSSPSSCPPITTASVTSMPPPSAPLPNPRPPPPLPPRRPREPSLGDGNPPQQVNTVYFYGGFQRKKQSVKIVYHYVFICLSDYFSKFLGVGQLYLF
jgi:hypothetical protein